MGRALPEVWSALAGDSGPQGAPCSRSRRTVSLITSPAITLPRRRGDWSGCRSAPSPRRRQGAALGATRSARAQRFMGDKQLPTTSANSLHAKFLVEFFTYVPESESL